MLMPALCFLLPTAAYLIGSIPFGLVFVRVKTGVDIRTRGSGNIGATNALRVAGTWTALAVLVCDSLKGVAPIMLAQRFLFPEIFHARPWLVATMALAAVIGHMFPVYLKFRASGKGVATTMGCFLYLSPLACLLSLAVFLSATAITKRVSAGSLLASLALPILIWRTTQQWALTSAAMVIALLIAARHKTNISRLLSGREPRLGASDEGSDKAPRIHDGLDDPKAASRQRMSNRKPDDSR